MAEIIDSVLLPWEIMEGSRFGPAFNTVVLQSQSGVEQRIDKWGASRHAGTIGYGVRTAAQLADLKAFFVARRGRARGFLFFDFRDYSAMGVSLGTGDGHTTTFQLVKPYSSGGQAASRKVTRPIPSGTALPGGSTAAISVSVAGTPLVEGTGFTVDATTGVVTLTSAPANGAAVVASFQFYVPVRFDTDRMEATLEGVIGGWDSIPIVELRE
ncbi:MAG: DUF2460 domain-containing protein [Fimbriimonas ginsengisoli]|uniref:DUF2460 domain-containing protein n=1 Tax=Fimbriimonas ginsengisoli TaxID=1005039 RepID=A0A931LZQ3_FIMGI|nr:DUF2460 domain-containing protein [Fimbriimonas ginsengisoli]